MISGKYDALKPKKNTHKQGSENRQRELVIKARVNEAEKLEVMKNAETAGLTEGAYIRAQCLAKPKTRATRRPSVEVQTLARMLGELGKVGSNLNQIAHRLNMDGTATKAEVEAALSDLKNVSAAIVEISKK